MTRELTMRESAAARELCIARYLASKKSHEVPWDDYAGCFTCRADVVRLVDGPEPDDARDAARWRALIRAGGRVRVLGSAGLGENRKADGYAHIGLELWTIYPNTKPVDNEWCVERLTEYADIGAALTRDTNA